MTQGSVHEPDAELLSAEDAVADGLQLIELFHRKEAEKQRARPQLSLSSVLAAIDEFPPKDLLAVKQRLEARLLAK